MTQCDSFPRWSFDSQTEPANKVLAKIEKDSFGWSSAEGNGRDHFNAAHCARWLQRGWQGTSQSCEQVLWKFR
jgi:hypothetical protein